MTNELRRGSSRGFTLVELLIVIAIVGILASLAIAGYRMVRVRGAEAAAITALGAVNQAQFAFSQTCGNQRYSPTLAGLGVPMPTTGQAFLSPDMTVDPATKSGYLFVIEGTAALEAPPTCNGSAAGDVLQSDGRSDSPWQQRSPVLRDQCGSSRSMPTQRLLPATCQSAAPPGTGRK